MLPGCDPPSGTAVRTGMMSLFPPDGGGERLPGARSSGSHPTANLSCLKDKFLRYQNSVWMSCGSPENGRL